MSENTIDMKSQIQRQAIFRTYTELTKYLWGILILLKELQIIIMKDMSGIMGICI